MTAPLFELRGLSLTPGARAVYRDFSLTLPEGGITGIIGPNGCGKSTLLRCLAGLAPPQAGQVLFRGRPLAALAGGERARRIAFLPQDPPPQPEMTVAGLVAKGRTPWRRPFLPPSREDRRAVEAALAATGLADLRDRRMATLSGGQRQRAWLALALAQETGVILLDEPTSALDLPYQLALLRLLQDLAGAKGRSIVMVLHDLTLAGRFCDHVVGLADGQVVTAGPPANAITPEALDRLYGLRARVAPDPVFARPVVYPLE